jgi:hypothetical protein
VGFNIFASGTGKFHYQRDGFIDGDTFAPMKLVSELMTMSPNKEGVITTAIGHYQPGITDLAEGMATLEFLHLLNDSVCFLAMCSGASDGWISLSSTQTHLMWPDTKAFARYNFQPGDDPGAEFIKLVGPGLKETGLNNWGVLAALALVFSKFSDHIGEDARPIINISIDH